MKVIFGLGNPGKEYQKTRHNIGFMALDKLNETFNFEYKKENKFNSWIASGNYNKEKVLLVKPVTFMNLSGDAVIKIINYYKINLDDILILTDDINLNIGSVRLRQKGSAGGHNGLKDIINKLQTNEFKRIKIGISGPKDIELKDYVLSKFTKKELEILDKSLDLVRDAIIDFIKGLNFDLIQTKYNFVNKQTANN